MKNWILFGLLTLTSVGSFEFWYYANSPDDPQEETGLACGFNTDGSFQTIRLTSKREPAGFDYTRAQMSYYHSAAHQHHHKKKLSTL